MADSLQIEIASPRSSRRAIRSFASSTQRLSDSARKRNLDGGINSPLNPDTYTVEKAVSLREPTKVGYEFIGWFVQGASAKKTSLNAIMDGDMTLTAQWRAKEFIITVCLNNGQEDRKIRATYDVGYGFYERACVLVQRRS